MALSFSTLNLLVSKRSLAWLLMILTVLASSLALARTPIADEKKADAQLLQSVDEAISLQHLPRPAQRVHALILQGGPFQFEKDGSVFANRERILPRQKRGYYREYTVPPHVLSRSRGAKRIVCGGFAPTKPDACYYTANHYSSFQLIVTP